MTIPPARYMIENLGDSLRIIIRSEKHWLQVFLFCVMFVPWVIVGIGGGAILGPILGSLISDAISSTTQGIASWLAPIYVTLFSLAFLGMWIMVGTSRLYATLWHLGGREVIHITHKSIILCRQVFGLGRPQEYLVDHFSDLRIAPLKISGQGRWNIESSWAFADGSIMFDYNTTICRFGSELAEADAQRIVDIIKQQFPQYRIKRPARHRMLSPKWLVSIWLITAVITFLAGGIAHSLQQTTKAEWLESLAGVLGGLYIFVLGAPLLFVRQLNIRMGVPPSTLRTFFAWLIGLPVTLMGLSLALSSVISLLAILY